MYSEVYAEHIKSRCNKIAEKIAPEITASLIFDNNITPTEIVEHAVSIFTDCLKEQMLSDLRNYSWRV
jgi:hypothetical protein